jgi:uncharacterized membrane protein YgcG
VTYRPRAVIALLAVAISALALAACGGSGKSSNSSASSSGSDATSLISQTFSGKHNVKSGKVALDFSLNLQGSGSPGPIDVKLSGPFQSQGKKALPKFDFDLTAGAAGQTFNAGLATDAKAAVVKFQGTNYAIPANLFSQFKQSFDKAKAQSPSSTGASGFKELGIDPAKLISKPKIVGDENVAGTDTTHISAPINIDALLNAVDTLLSKAQQLGVAQTQGVPTKLTDAQKQEVRNAVKSATLDVWTGKDDKTFRKLQLKTSITPPSGKIKRADVALTVELSDVNKPQTITLPTNTKPISDLTSQLGGLGGALGGLGGSSGSSGSGSSGGGSSGSGSSGSASTKKLQQYETCIQKAGTDINKAQKCAKLLTG